MIDKYGLETCDDCHKPAPRYYCWEGRNRTDCPCGKPPRWEYEGGDNS